MSNSSLDDTGANSASPTDDEKGQQSLVEFMEGRIDEDDAAAKPETPEAGESPAPQDETTDKPKGAAAAPEASGEDAKSESDKVEESEEEEAEEEVPFHKHPRWQALREKLEAAELKAMDLERQLADREPDIQAYGNLRRFCDEHQLENADVDRAFEAMAAIKSGDDATIVEILRPYFEGAISRLQAQPLPADLQARVDSGDIPEDIAHETARLRASRQVASAAGANPPRTQIRREPATTAAAAEPDKALGLAQAAVNKAEAALRKSDLDYPAIRDDVKELFGAWISTLRQVPTPSETVAKFNQIVASRKAMAAKFGGRSRNEIPPREQASGRTAPTTPVQPGPDESLLGFMQRKIDAGG